MARTVLWLSVGIWVIVRGCRGDVFVAAAENQNSCYAHSFCGHIQVYIAFRASFALRIYILRDFTEQRKLRSFVAALFASLASSLS